MRGGWLMRVLFVGLLLMVAAGLIAFVAVGAWRL
jgi:hypothetical protein